MYIGANSGEITKTTELGKKAQYIFGTISIILMRYKYIFPISKTNLQFYF